MNNIQTMVYILYTKINDLFTRLYDLHYGWYNKLFIRCLLCCEVKLILTCIYLYLAWDKKLFHTLPNMHACDIMSVCCTLNRQ